MSDRAHEWSAAWRPRLNRALEERLPEAREDGTDLAHGMRYAVLTGGKRLRPLLVLGSCAAVGGEAVEALPAALAVELLHAYSLVHDDLPAMDDDDLRRGQPTVHVKFGEAAAILVGDALQCLAFEVLVSAPLPPDRVRRQAMTLARAAGHRGMVGGQALDLGAEGSPADAAAVERIHRMKTGALIGACMALGAEAAGSASPLADRMREIGQRVGLAFQIQDDILDETATTTRLGKKAGKDAAAGKATWPAAVGLERARETAHRLMDAVVDDLAPCGAAGAPLRALVRDAVSRQA